MSINYSIHIIDSLRNEINSGTVPANWLDRRYGETDEEDCANLNSALITTVQNNMLPFMVATKFRYVNLSEVFENENDLFAIANDEKTTGELWDLIVMHKFKVLNPQMNFNIDSFITKAWSEIAECYMELYYEAFKRWKTARMCQWLINIVSVPETKMYGAVGTPLTLVDEMLNNMSVNWKTSTFLDPACGNGTFLYGAQQRMLASGMTVKETLNSLTGVDIDLRKCYVTAALLNTNDDNTIVQVFCGNSLTGLDFNQKLMNIKSKVTRNFSGFDVVLGNPPFQAPQQASGRRGGASTLWDRFVTQAFEVWCKPNGVVSLIHPVGWRRGKGKFDAVGELLRSKEILHLSFNGLEAGQKTFNCFTGFDWYVALNAPRQNDTLVIDDRQQTLSLNLKNFKAIPNYFITEITRFFAKEDEESVKVLHSDSLYDHRKPWISKEKTEHYCYPVIYTLTANKINLIYSSKKGPHFGVSKLIWTNGAATRLFLDEKGDYGLCEFAYGIVDTIENLKKIQQAMESTRFKELMEACKFSANKWDFKIIALLRKDFWKEFV